MRLSPSFFRLRITTGTFVIAEPTALVQPFSLLLGTMYHHIMCRGYSLSRKADRRRGVSVARRSSPVLGLVAIRNR